MPILYPEGLEKGFFSDMSSDEQTRWGQTLRPTALGIVASPAPESDPKSWRIAIIISEEKDVVMSLGFQQDVIEKAKEAGAVFEDVKLMKTGHFVQISHTKEVANWILHNSYP
jgi:hypothetical protein